MPVKTRFTSHPLLFCYNVPRIYRNQYFVTTATEVVGAELFATDTSAHSVMNTTCHHDAQNEKLTNPEPKYAPNSAALVNPPIGSSPEATPFRISIRTIANKRAAQPKPPVSSRISRTQLCGCEGRYSAFRCGITLFAPAILLEASIP